MLTVFFSDGAKKTNLWLNRGKKTKPKNKPRKTQLSPTITPVISPKKRRLNSALSLTPNDGQELIDEKDGNWSDSEYHDDNVNVDAETLHNFKLALNELEREGLVCEFRMFLCLGASKKFPMDNISFLLFLETVRFFGYHHQPICGIGNKLNVSGRLAAACFITNFSFSWEDQNMLVSMMQMSRS